MQTATYVALSRQSVLERSIDVVSNNIANISTPSYKNQQPLFRELLASAGNGTQISYVGDGGVIRDTRAGNLTYTGNSLDAGINGTGYYSVDTPDGTRYTRNSHFVLDQNGQLTTPNGNPILSAQGQPIVLPRGSRSISIGGDGSIAADGGAVGQIGLAHFDNEQGLVAAAGGLYVTDETPTADTTSKIVQGTVEDSNVQPILELTKLLDLQRSYSNAQQIVEGEDNRLRNAIDKLGRTV